MKRIEKIKFNFHSNRFNKVVNRFTKSIASDLKVELGTGFTYGEDKITYSLAMTELSDRLFRESVAKAAKRMVVLEQIERINPDIFIMSLLHEIGHYYTEEEYDSAWEEDERKLIALKYTGSTRESDKVRFNWQYFNLPSERAATEWAVDFMVKNVNHVREWDDRLNKALLRFFKGIGVV